VLVERADAYALIHPVILDLLTRLGVIRLGAHEATPDFLALVRSTLPHTRGKGRPKLEAPAPALLKRGLEHDIADQGRDAKRLRHMVFDDPVERQGLADSAALHLHQQAMAHISEQQRASAQEQRMRQQALQQQALQEQVQQQQQALTQQLRQQQQQQQALAQQLRQQQQQQQQQEAAVATIANAAATATVAAAEASVASASATSAAAAAAASAADAATAAAATSRLTGADAVGKMIVGGKIVGDRPTTIFYGASGWPTDRIRKVLDHLGHMTRGHAGASSLDFRAWKRDGFQEDGTPFVAYAPRAMSQAPKFREIFARQFLGPGAPPVIIHGLCAPGKDYGYNDPAHVDALLNKMQNTLQLQPTAQLIVVGCATSPCLP
jgi:chemotaxis protein histidine kinase CheA